jgi:hypothetical protein
MVLVEIRRGRSLDQRLELGRRIVDICGDVLGVPKRTVLVEFSVHSGDEMLRDGEWAGDWTAAEAPRKGRLRSYNLRKPAETNGLPRGGYRA